jgi:hypothetical protein
VLDPFAPEDVTVHAVLQPFAPEDDLEHAVLRAFAPEDGSEHAVSEPIALDGPSRHRTHFVRKTATSYVTAFKIGVYQALRAARLPTFLLL